MSKVQDYIQSTMDDLRDQRDKLTALLHDSLDRTRHDLQDTWQQLESRWQELKAAETALREKADEAGHELKERARHLADEIRAGYHELQSRLRHESAGDGSTQDASAGGSGAQKEVRQTMIAEAAYYRASRRGFVDGDPVEDWLSAEREIDQQLNAQSQAQTQRSEAA
ncbi:MAG: DUF2934 domain-containing protein [Pseudomonadota bacterium]